MPSFPVPWPVLGTVVACLLAAQESAPKPTEPTPSTNPAGPSESAPSEDPVLEVGKPLDDEITDEDPIVVTPALDAKHTDASVRGKSYRLRFARPGVHTIELRSYFFDAYLVVRDATGGIVAEDDNGLIRKNARVVLDSGRLKGAATVQACALHGGTGPLALELVEGKAEPIAPGDRPRLELEDVERAVEALELEDDGHSLRYADALEEAGFRRWKGDQFVEAEAHFRRELALREELRGPDHPETARALFNLAEQMAGQKRYEDAIALHQRALKIRESVLGPEARATIESLEHLGRIMEKAGRDAEAASLVERALAAAQRTLGVDDPDTLACAAYLQHFYGARGLLAKAIGPAEVALAALGKQRGTTHPTTLAVEQDLATWLSVLGRYGEARMHLERVLAAVRQSLGAEHSQTRAAMVQLAGVFAALDQWAEAEGVGKEARILLEKAGARGGREWLLVMQILASVDEHRGRDDDARRGLEQALAESESIFGPEDVQTADCLRNLALFLTRRDADRSRQMFERALAIYEKREGPGSSIPASCLAQLSSVLFELHRNDEAKAAARRAITSLRDRLGPVNPQTAMVTEAFAHHLIDLGETTEAVALLREALDAYELHFAATLWSLSPDEQLHYVRSFRDSLDFLLSVTPGKDADATHAESTARYVLEWKGRVLRSCVDQGARLASSGGPVAQRRLDDLRMVEASLSSMVYARDAAASAEREERIATLRHRKEQLEVELAQLSPGLVKRAPTPAELGAALAPGTVAIDFLVHEVAAGGPRLHAWIHSKTAPVRSLDLGPVDPIESAVKRFLAQFRSSRGAAAIPAAAPDGSALATELRGLLWEPIRAAIGDATLVIISPDSFLGAFPFELLADTDGRLLIESRAFVYLQDLASLPQMIEKTPENEPTPPPDLLVAGGFDYNRSDAVRPDAASEAASPPPDPDRGGISAFWGPLPATRDEALSLESLHELLFGERANHLLLVGAAATEERLKRELPRFRNVHLATHGFFEPDGFPALRAPPGYLSGLVCAGANHFSDAAASRAPRDDGYLSAEELSRLDLSKADLMVLSACDTATGRAESGEGMIGLRRSLRLAGVATVVSALWKVDDEATAELMKRFYVGLWQKKLGKLDALRQSQLSLLRENVARYRDPRPGTWGAFVLDGDWR